MFPIIKAVEVLVGLALLSNRFVPLALVVVTPIVVNIFLVHTVLDPAGIGMTLMIALLHVAQTYFNWSAYKSLLSSRQLPVTA